MKFKILSLLPLLALPALAQDRWQVGLGLDFDPSMKMIYQDQSARDEFKRASRILPSLQLGFQAWKGEQSSLSITGEYQPKCRHHFTAQGNSWGGDSVQGSADIEIQTWAPGVQWTYHSLADAGIGVQYRFTQLKGRNHAVNQNRPWLYGSVSFTFKDLEPVKPFVALRVAGMLGTTSAPAGAELTTEGGQKQLLRFLAPRYEIGLQAGIRF